MPKLMVAVVAMAILAGCSFPRGAAIQSEIVPASNKSETPTFDVVPVTRAAIPALATWPATGWSGQYRWLKSSRGPSSSVIRTGDRINLTIWDSQENSLLTTPGQKTVQMSGLEVSPGGTVFVPYVENVVVRGLTPAGARERIQSQLTPIAPSAQVQLALEVGQDNSVDLVGGVRAPGTFPLPGRNYTILSLLAQGGGIVESLRNPLVRLIRGGDTYEIRADDLFESGSRNAVLRGGDKIVVREDDRSFTALGASGTEDLIYFPKEHVSALEALSLMGGLADSRADPEGVLILREYEPGQIGAAGQGGPTRQQVVFTIDLTSADGLFAARKFRVNPGDTILATESPVLAAQAIFGLFGNFVGFGNQLTALSR